MMMMMMMQMNSERNLAVAAQFHEFSVLELAPRRSNNQPKEFIILVSTWRAAFELTHTREQNLD